MLLLFIYLFIFNFVIEIKKFFVFIGILFLKEINVREFICVLILFYIK